MIIVFCLFFCTVYNFTEYFMMSRNGSACVTFHTYNKRSKRLRSVTCRMGSHSVTCHPRQVNAPQGEHNNKYHMRMSADIRTLTSATRTTLMRRTWSSLSKRRKRPRCRHALVSVRRLKRTRRTTRRSSPPSWKNRKKTKHSTW